MTPSRSIYRFAVRGARPSTLRRLFGSSTRSDGQALVEMALTVPLIAGFVFTMIEICLVFYSYCLISEYAREGSRYGMVRGATCVTAPPANAPCAATHTSIESYVAQIGLPNLGRGTITQLATFPDGNQNAGSRVQVKVTYAFPVALPYLPKGTIQMSSTSVMYIVQ